MANKLCHAGEGRHPVTENIDIWTTAQGPKTNGVGRGNGSANQSLYGIKKLRELILELAVCGKLVPQDSDDEPASVLLKKIAKEKDSLVKEDRIKKEKPLPEIPEGEKEFELPNGWEWVRLGTIGETNIGLTYSPKDISDSGTPVLRSNNVQKGKLDLTDLVRVNVDIKNNVIVQEGDLLICARNGSKALVGKTAQITGLSEEMAFGAFMAIFRSTINNYVLYFINSPLFRKMIDDVNTTTINQITQNNLKTTIFPLPPLAEQQRIVAKVDELMALCDQLEQQQTGKNATHQTLVEALLATLTITANPRELREAWQRIADNFDTMFTTEQSIDQFKQTILQLAVMGKLVPQATNDEPASVPLEKIAKEKARLIKEGKIKKEILSLEIGEDERPFELPAGWAFVRLADLSQLITKGSSPNWQGVSYTENPEDVLFITSENVSSYILELNNKKYVERKFNDIEPRSILMKGDFLMNIVGASIGRTAIYNIDDLANINQAVCLIRVFNQFLNSKYLLHFFNCAICVSYMFDKQVDNARANLSMGNIAKFIIPIPPLDEQHRIVAKVDELMALCDTLKARLKEAQTTQIHLADAIVEQAVG